MGNSGIACVRRACFKANIPRPGRFFERQRAIRQRYYDIVVDVHGFSTALEAPLGDNLPVIFELNYRGGFDSFSIIPEMVAAPIADEILTDHQYIKK